MSNQSEKSFSRRFRLTHAGEFKQVFRENLRQGDTSMMILVSKKSGLVPRLGFAIGKKQIPKAVQRNWLKRIFRESFRKSRHRLPAHDMVIMVQRSVLNLDQAQFSKSLKKHWDSIIKQCKKL